MLNPTLKLIEHSYPQIEANADRLTTLFSQRIFELDPKLALLLPQELPFRKAMLLTGLSFVVNNLHQLDVMHLRAQALGHRFVKQGLLPAHYELLRCALLESFSQLPSDILCPEARVAWNEICTMLANTMRRAAETELTR